MIYNSVTEAVAFDYDPQVKGGFAGMSEGLLESSARNNISKKNMFNINVETDNIH